MNIVYIATSAIPSYSANSLHVVKMCNAFGELGHEVNLLVPARKDRIKNVNNTYSFYEVPSKSFSIHYLFQPNIKGKILIFYIATLFYHFKHKPDIVYGRSLLPIVIASLFGYYTAFETHSPIWNRNRFNKLLIKFLFKQKKFKKFIIITKALKKRLIEDLNIPAHKIFVAPDGADRVKNNFHHDSKKNRNFNVGYIGNLYKGKGLEVIEKIAPDTKDIQYIIIGGNENEIEYWKNKINTSNVHFFGHMNQSQIKKHIQYIDVFLLPNHKNRVSSIGKNENIAYYTSPLKMFEYMSYGKPIVASNLKVLKEVLNSNNSILCDPEKPNQWINAIYRLKESKKLRIEIGKQAKYDLENFYTWEIRAKNILKEILN